MRVRSEIARDCIKRCGQWQAVGDMRAEYRNRAAQANWARWAAKTSTGGMRRPAPAALAARGGPGLATRSGAVAGVRAPRAGGPVRTHHR